MLSLHINSFNVFGWIDELASIRMLFNWKLVSIHSNCISLCSTLPGGCLAERWSTLNDQSTLTKVALIARKHVSDFYLGSHMKPVCSTTKEGFWVNSRKSIHTLQLTSIDPSSTEPMTQLNSPKLQLSSLFFSCLRSRHTLNPRPVISCLRRSILWTIIVIYCESDLGLDWSCAHRHRLSKYLSFLLLKRKNGQRKGIYYV